MNYFTHLFPFALTHNISPLNVNIPQGNFGAIFVYMLGLGMQYIKAGTGHLLFLFTMLLPATLVVNRSGKNWGAFGGVGYSLVRIFKIFIAFAIGHFVTLLMGAIGIVRFPGGWVEVLIAISILVAAIHAHKPIFAGKEKYIAFGFGLIHGMAFAGALAGLNLGFGRMAISIIGFNAGVELMLLFIVTMALPWFMMLSYNNFYKGLRIAGSMLAAVASTGWMIEQINGVPNLIGSSVCAAAACAQWLLLVLAIAAIMSFFVRVESTPAA